MDGILIHPCSSNSAFEEKGSVDPVRLLADLCDGFQARTPPPYDAKEQKRKKRTRKDQKHEAKVTHQSKTPTLYTQHM
jgi:hypothetical protein